MAISNVRNLRNAQVLRPSKAKRHVRRGKPTACKRRRLARTRTLEKWFAPVHTEHKAVRPYVLGYLVYALAPTAAYVQNARARNVLRQPHAAKAHEAAFALHPFVICAHAHPVQLDHCDLLCAQKHLATTARKRNASTRAIPRPGPYARCDRQCPCRARRRAGFRCA